MNARKLYVLRYRIGFYLAFLRHGVHLYLLGILYELAHHHRVLAAHIGREF